MSPAEARASRGVREPSVSISSTRRSKSVDCSTRTGSTVKATRRTGEKMASTGMTPMVAGALVLVRRQVAPATLDGEVDGDVALGVEGGDVLVRAQDLDVRGELEVAGGDGARAPLVQADGHRFVGMHLEQQVLQLRMMSVTSSFARQGRELVEGLVEPDLGHGGTRDGRQQRPSQ